MAYALLEQENYLDLMQQILLSTEPNSYIHRHQLMFLLSQATLWKLVFSPGCPHPFFLRMPVTAKYCLLLREYNITCCWSIIILGFGNLNGKNPTHWFQREYNQSYNPPGIECLPYLPFNVQAFLLKCCVLNPMILCSHEQTRKEV